MKASGDYDWKRSSPPVDVGDGVKQINDLLVASMSVVLTTLDETGTRLPESPAVATDLRGRVRELGLGSHVKYADDEKCAKHFAKLAKKMPLEPGEQILASFSDSTLGGCTD